MPVICSSSDSAYFFMAEKWLENVFVLYPDTRILFYDLGLTERQRKTVAERFPRTEVIRLSEPELYDTPNRTWNLSTATAQARAITHVARFTRWQRKLIKPFLKYFPGSPMAALVKRRCDYWENVALRRVACMRDASARCGPENILFLDADAIVFQKLDILDQQDFDIGMTTYPKETWQFDDDRCRMLACGAIFFGRDVAARTAFLDHWWRECLKTDEPATEEAAATRMLQHGAPGLLDGANEAILTLDGNIIRVSLLPTDLYNFHDIENLMVQDKSRIFIIHFTFNWHRRRFFLDAVRRMNVFYAALRE